MGHSLMGPSNVSYHRQTGMYGASRASDIRPLSDATEIFYRRQDHGIDETGDRREAPCVSESIPGREVGTRSAVVKEQVL